MITQVTRCLIDSVENGGLGTLRYHYISQVHSVYHCEPDKPYKDVFLAVE